jgi:hypothetical protein
LRSPWLAYRKLWADAGEIAKAAIERVAAASKVGRTDILHILRRAL